MSRESILIFFIVWSHLSFGQERVLHQIDSLMNTADYAAANRVIQKWLPTADAHNKGMLLNRNAEIFIIQGQLDSAEHTLTGITIKQDAQLEILTKTNLGSLYLNTARHELALQSLQSAYQLIQYDNNNKTREAAQCLANLSLVYWSSGKLNQAEEYGAIAFQIREGIFGAESEEVAASSNDLGLVYSSTDPDKALGYYEKALSIYQKRHGQDHPKIAIVSNNIGAIYRQKEFFDDAITHFETALSIWKKLYPNGHPNQAAAMVNLGRTYSRIHDRKMAIDYFKNALEAYQKFYQGKHPDIASVLNLIGTMQLENNEYDDALSSFQQALIANSPTFKDKRLVNNPSAASFYNGKVMLYSMRLKAQALESLHFGKTLKLSDLRRALATLQLCDTLIDNIRHHSSDEQDKIELGESASEVYEDGVRLSLEIAELVIKPKPYQAAAFYFAEKSKSAVLQESIADAEAKSFAGLPPKVTEQELALKSTLTMLVQKLAQKPTPDEEKYLRDALFTTNQEYAAFTRQLEKDYPRYFDLKYNQSSPTITSLQGILDDHTALLSFFISEKNKRIYQFIITRKYFKVNDIKLPERFDKLVKGLTNSLLFNDAQTFKVSSAELSKLLVPALPPHVSELIIIPSGRLGTIPFEVLYASKKLKPKFEDMPFLLHRYAISYEFSAGLLTQKVKNPSTKQRSKPAIFLCAPITFPEGDHLDDLPGTETEVVAIGKLFGDRIQRTAKSEEATEEFVKSAEMAKYNYLHFATHGIVDEASPELSRIFLQPGSSEDGHLYAGEIYNLKLNADLAVLSACQTGLGKFTKGEGVIGLSRALVYAGAKNIMVSFWSVADESTAQLMTGFYQVMLANPDQSYREILRAAKIKMVRSHQYASPYYWAPFILIGNDLK